VQFSLLKLLLLVAVIAVSLATFGVWGIAITIFVTAQTFWIRRSANRVALVAIWGLVFVLGSCVVHGHREAYRLCHCRNNLKAIGLALHKYHDQYGQFPPQSVADAEGRPMHSWRVLILPYLDDPQASSVYAQYRFDEPWNGPRNQWLAAQAVEQFRCITTDAAEPGTPLATHYVAVTGPGTVWPGPTGACVGSILDGCKNTILVVEIADSDIHWMQPRDVMLEEALSGQNGPCAVPSSHHYVERTYFFCRTYPLAGNVLMADGSCQRFENRPSRDELAALLSIGGGESIDDDTLFWPPRDASALVLDVVRCMGFALYLLFLALLVW